LPLVHHELCFGCGRTNLFGLLLEVEQVGPGAVAGRCFIKQDHQGSRRGQAHDGIVATALSEAMAFACGGIAGSTAEALEVTFAAPAPVGEFLEIEAQAETGEGDRMSARAHARVGEVHIATAAGSFRS
jgi:acyl-coenzyme A thioesterase PaaI-like protein